MHRRVERTSIHIRTTSEYIFIFKSYEDIDKIFEMSKVDDHIWSQKTSPKLTLFNPFETILKVKYSTFHRSIRTPLVKDNFFREWGFLLTL